MGLIASKFAFLPPNPPGPLHVDCQFIKTLNGHEIPIYFKKHLTSKYILIFSHGNAEDLTHCTAFLDEMSRVLNVSVLGYEYLGYPHTISGDMNSSLSSALKPSEEGCYESIDAAYEHVTNFLKFDASHQIWMGQSIGSGPTVDFVARRGKQKISLAGMILISPFNSAVSLISPFIATFYDIFANGSKIHCVNSPTLIIHGSADDVVPSSQSRLLEINGNHHISRCVVEGAGHNNLFQYPETWNLLSAFVRNLVQ